MVKDFSPSSIDYSAMALVDSNNQMVEYWSAVMNGLHDSNDDKVCCVFFISFVINIFYPFKFQVSFTQFNSKYIHQWIINWLSTIKTELLLSHLFQVYIISTWFGVTTFRCVGHKKRLEKAVLRKPFFVDCQWWFVWLLYFCLKKDFV